MLRAQTILEKGFSQKNFLLLCLSSVVKSIYYSLLLTEETQDEEDHSEFNLFRKVVFASYALASLYEILEHVEIQHTSTRNLNQENNLNILLGLESSLGAIENSEKCIAKYPLTTRSFYPRQNTLFIHYHGDVCWKVGKSDLNQIVRKLEYGFEQIKYTYPIDHLKHLMPIPAACRRSVSSVSHVLPRLTEENASLAQFASLTSALFFGFSLYSLQHCDRVPASLAIHFLMYATSVMESSLIAKRERALQLEGFRLKSSSWCSSDNKLAFFDPQNKEIQHVSTYLKDVICFVKFIQKGRNRYLIKFLPKELHEALRDFQHMLKPPMTNQDEAEARQTFTR